MYKTFRVKNFRCFKDLQINDLGRVNLIAGKNNTGKTALLEAMYLHTRPLEPKTLLSLQQSRDLDIPEEDLSDYWSQFFLGRASNLTISLEVGLDKPSHTSGLEIHELSEDEDLVSLRHGYGSMLSSGGMSEFDAFEVTSGIVAGLRLYSYYEADGGNSSRDVFLSSNPKLPALPIFQSNDRAQFVPVQGRPDKQDSSMQFSALDEQGKISLLIEIVRMFEPSLTDLRLAKMHGELLICGRTNGSLIPLKLMGEGVNRVSHFLITMLSNPISYLFIDEIENGIHYTVQTELWKAIGQIARDQKIQVFSTTHSLEMIQAAHEAFKDDDIDDFRFHRLYQDTTTGNIEARTYNEYSIGAAISKDREVRG